MAWEKIDEKGTAWGVACAKVRALELEVKKAEEWSVDARTVLYLLQAKAALGLEVVKNRRWILNGAKWSCIEMSILLRLHH